MLLFVISITIAYSNDNFIFYPIPDDMKSWGFEPTSVAVGINDHIYFLDSINKSAAVISDHNIIKIIDVELDDPISIVQTGLSIWILSRMDNQVVEYDLTLNKVNTFLLSDIYPDFMGADFNGNIYILSSYEQGVWRNPYQKIGIPLIDLSNYSEIGQVVDFEVNPFQHLAILDDESNLHIFNHIGIHISSKSFESNLMPSNVYWWNESWEIVYNTLSIDHKNIVKKDDLNLLDVSTNKNFCVKLTTNGWWTNKVFD